MRPIFRQATQRMFNRTTDGLKPINQLVCWEYIQIGAANIRAGRIIKGMNGIFIIVPTETAAVVPKSQRAVGTFLKILTLLSHL